MNDVCIVLPTFGLHEMTKRCLRLVKERAGMDYDLILVDDGYRVPFEDESVNILRLEKNGGFTHATNQGIIACSDRYKYILFLNNDIVPEHNFLKELYDHMEKDYVTGIATSVRFSELNGLKTYEYYGVDLIRGFQSCWTEQNETEPMYCDWMPTCCSLIRYDMIREIGLLDKQFRQHCSDSDYCLRANMSGWNVATIPKSVVEHRHETTMRSMCVEPLEDQNKFIAKLTGLKYKELMDRLPLDRDRNIWGKITFETYDKTDKSTTT